MTSGDALGDERGELMDRAAALLTEHRPDENGLCAGCMAWWGRYIPYAECANAQWAVRVIETHGQPESAWLVPSHTPDWLTSVTAGHTNATVCAARSATYTADRSRAIDATASVGEVTSCKRTGEHGRCARTPGRLAANVYTRDVGRRVAGR